MCFYGFSNLNSSSVDVVASPREQQSRCQPTDKGSELEHRRCQFVELFLWLSGAWCIVCTCTPQTPACVTRPQGAAGRSPEIAGTEGAGEEHKKGLLHSPCTHQWPGQYFDPQQSCRQINDDLFFTIFPDFFTLLQSVSLCYYSVKSIFESFCSDNAVFRQLRHLGRRELTRFVARSTISGADRTFFHQSGYAFSKICKVMFFVDVGIDYILKSSLENSPMKRYWLRCESCDDFPAFIFCICHFSKLQYDFSFMNFPLTVAAVNQYFSKNGH